MAGKESASKEIAVKESASKEIASMEMAGREVQEKVKKLQVARELAGCK